MPTTVSFLLTALAAYLIGSIPPGYLYVKWFKHVDVRTVQSGRTGGTNVFRAAGTTMGVITALSDVLKGAGAVWVTQALFGGALTTSQAAWGTAIAGLAAVIGHNWSIYIGFGGGAGTTPNVGWASTVWWPIFPLNLLAGLALMLLTGIASLTSLVIAGLLPVIFAIRFWRGLDPTPAFLAGSLATALTIVWSLRPNIRRLLDGTERIVGPRARRQARANQTPQA